ncbi:MAG: cyclic pyranopterin monophosphate synthase MoaC [Planctomycetaceae bacterium]|nr:cyclic pyranopterin monophosphate synthase MoaC [Planctomycetaceae bacterium]
MNDPLTHFDDAGASRMVDVSAKPITVRIATAEGRVTMRRETLTLIQNRQLAKGDVFEVARLAGIMATKRTSDLIPLCHPLAIDGVKLDFSSSDGTLSIIAEVRTTARTGVEMEALTAVTVAALTIYDMCKSVDRDMSLGPFRLIQKSGGRSGDYRRESAGNEAV